MAADYIQYGRKATLLLLTGPLDGGNSPDAYLTEYNERGIDLSAFHFTFETKQQDVESPNNCSIRVYNLSETLVRQIRGEYSRVVLQAGYEASFGVIFDGTIKQFRIGRVSATDTYLDILAADGDISYNFAVVNRTVAAGSNSDQRLKEVWGTLSPYGVTPGEIAPYTGGVLPRGKVLFGMARAVLRQEAQLRGSTWNVSNGLVNITPLDGYLPGEAVVLSSLTGMIGIPESTTEGLRVRSLLNPKLQVGGLMQIDNKTVNQTVQQNPNAAPVAYNQYTGLQLLAKVTDDGVYRMFVVEHKGDTRGQDWYTDIVGLALDPSTNKVKPYG